MSSNETTIQLSMDRLADMLSGLSDIHEVNRTINTTQLHLSTLIKLKENPKKLLSQIKVILLHSENENLDYESLLNLVDKIVTKCPYEYILEVFSEEDLVLSLKSNIKNLVKSACKVIAKSCPKNLFVPSQILNLLLDLYFTESTDIAEINEIENVFKNLSVDVLVRREMFKNNIQVLKTYKKGDNTLLFSRLLNLLIILFEHINQNEFEKDLFVISNVDIKNFLKADILFFINIIEYYTTILHICTSDIDKFGWGLKYFLHASTMFSNIYKDKKEFYDVEHFAKTYLFKLFKLISYADMELFKKLDDEFLHISMKNEDIIDFLTFMNPKYLITYHTQMLDSNLILKQSFLSVVKNLLTTEESFNYIKAKITSDSICSMQYYEQMILIEKMTCYQYSSDYLLRDLPKVMSNLLYNKNSIIETSTATLRRRAFENLLFSSPQSLDVWSSALKNEYFNILNGRVSKN